VELQAELWVGNAGKAPIALGADNFRLCRRGQGGYESCTCCVEAVRVGDRCPWSDMESVWELAPGEARVADSRNLSRKEAAVAVWAFYLRAGGDWWWDRDIGTDEAPVLWPPLP
jgi:hypothetical protein